MGRLERAPGDTSRLCALETAAGGRRPVCRRWAVTLVRLLDLDRGEDEKNAELEEARAAASVLFALDFELDDATDKFGEEP